MDSDGDNDVMMYLNSRGVVLFENNYPDDWRIIRLSDYPEFKDYKLKMNFEVADLDNNGYIDICQSLMDKNGKHFMAIMWNRGNYSFDIEFSNKLAIDGVDIFDIQDMNSDGAPDIIMGLADYDGTEIVEINTTVLFNHYPQRDLYIDKLPYGDQLRAGSYQKIEWTGSIRKDLRDRNFNYSISISYNGEDGVYYNLLNGKSAWWRYWTVPDFPTNNGYLKIDIDGRVATYGPITIYSKNDTKYLVKPSFSVQEYIANGRDVDVILEPSPRITSPVQLDLSLVHANGSIDLGSHTIQPGVTETFEWSAPASLFELDTRFREEFSYDALDYVITSDESYHFLSNSYFFENTEVKTDDIVGRGMVRNISLHTYAADGTDLTHSSTFKVKRTEGPIEIWKTSSNTFGFKCDELGEASVSWDVSCFGVDREVYQPFTVKKSVMSLNLSVESTDFRTGKTIEITSDPRDHLNESVTIDWDEVNWNVSGPAEIINQGPIFIQLRILSPGLINVSCNVYFETSNVSEELRLWGSPLINDTKVVGIDSTFRINHSTILIPKSFSIRGDRIENTSFSWDVSGPAETEVLDGDRLSLKPIDKDLITITLTATYLNEEHTYQYEIIPEIGLLYVDLNLSNHYLPVGEFVNGMIEVYGTDERPYDDEYDLEIEVADTSMLSYDLRDDKLTLRAKRSGSTYIRVIASTDYVEISRDLPLDCFYPVDDIIYNGPRDLSRTISSDFEIEIIDTNEKNIVDSTIEISIGEKRIPVNGLSGTLNINETGTFDMRILSVLHGYEYDKEFEITVHPMATKLVVATLLDHPRVNERIRLEGDMILEGGGSVNATDLIAKELPYDFTLDENGSYLVAGKRGAYNLTFSGIYFNQELESDLQLIIIDKPILTRVEIMNWTSDGKNYMKLTALDQYGIDITDRCNITYEGDYDLMENRSLRITGDSISYTVSMDDTTIEDDLVFGKDQKDFPILLVSFISAVILIIFTMILFWLYIAKVRDRDLLEDPE